MDQELKCLEWLFPISKLFAVTFPASQHCPMPLPALQNGYLGQQYFNDVCYGFLLAPLTNDKQVNIYL